MVDKYITKLGDRFYVLYVDFQKALDSLVHLNVFTRMKTKDFQQQVCKGITYCWFIEVFYNLGSFLYGHGSIQSHK